VRVAALAGLLVLAVAVPAPAADLEPCADSPTARCGTIAYRAVHASLTWSLATRDRTYLRGRTSGGRAPRLTLATP
jgi:hypothetical protein